MSAPIRNESDHFELGGELSVRRLGFGAMRITGADIIGPPSSKATAVRLVETAMDLGVDFIDTADSYGPGTSERLLHEAGAPQRAVVASKAGLVRNADGEWLRHGEPAFLRNQVLCSLDRLGVETIDLYQFHGPDDDVPFADSVHAFAEMRDRGQIHHVGLSNVTVSQLDAAREIVDIAAVQNRYNVANREHEAVLRACEAADIAFIPWGPLYPMQDEPPAAVQTVASELAASPWQVGLAWLLEHSAITLPIPGTSNLEHLRENVAASQLSLRDEQLARLDDIDERAEH